MPIGFAGKFSKFRADMWHKKTITGRQNNASKIGQSTDTTTITVFPYMRNRGSTEADLQRSSMFLRFSGATFRRSMCVESTSAHFSRDSIRLHGWAMEATSSTHVSLRFSCVTANLSRPRWCRSPSKIHTPSLVWSTQDTQRSRIRTWLYIFNKKIQKKQYIPHTSIVLSFAVANFLSTLYIASKK